MIWFALVIPLIAGGLLLLFYKKNIVPWEPLLPFPVVLLIILAFKFGAETSMTTDVEYWGTYLTEARYYEDWDEWIEQTCTEQYACGTDAEGRTEYCTRTYDCSYRDYHPEYWVGIDNTGNTYGIDGKQYNEFAKRFKNATFIELNRDYDTDDGDMYKTVWDGSYETYEFIASSYQYENRAQASTSTFKYQKPDTAELRTYGIYDYPQISYWKKLPGILAPKDYPVSQALQKKLDWLNGRLGHEKEVRVWVLLFKNQPPTAGHVQEARWDGGNKNEFTVCIGLDDNDKVEWAHVFAWSESYGLKVDTRYYIQNQDSLDLAKTIDYLETEIKEQFVRRPFETEFSYLSIELPLSTIMWTYGISLVLTVLVSIWSVRNEFDALSFLKRGYY